MLEAHFLTSDKLEDLGWNDTKNYSQIFIAPQEYTST